MKVGSKIFFWPLLSDNSRASLAAKKQLPPGEFAHAAKTRFKAFTAQMPSKDLPTLEMALKDIDLKLLNELAQGTKVRTPSFHRFIASQLQREPIDDNTKQRLKRAVAIKKMHALVKQMKEEVKTIELRRISFSKG